MQARGRDRRGGEHTASHTANPRDDTQASHRPDATRPRTELQRRAAALARRGAPNNIINNKAANEATTTEAALTNTAADVAITAPLTLMNNPTLITHTYTLAITAPRTLARRAAKKNAPP